jgi:hypothetical protein
MSLVSGVTAVDEGGAKGSGSDGEYGRYEFTCQLLELAMPPTPAMACAVTLELPPAAAEFDDAESE